MKTSKILRIAVLVYLTFLAPVELPAQVTTNFLSGRVLVKLLADYLRPKVYALNETTSTNAGTLLALNATNGSTLSEVTVGINPTDMAMTPAGDAVYVINAGDRTISKIDLNTFSVVEVQSISTPNAANLSYTLHIAAGRSNLVYFTDGAFIPRITTFDFVNGTNIAIFGAPVGGMVLTHDCNTMYTSYQYGWNTGGDDGTDPISYIQRVDTVTNNLTGLETSPLQRYGPLNAPILIDSSQTRVFSQLQMVSAANVSTQLTLFSDDIYAISLDGSLAFGSTEVFNTQNASLITNFPVSSTVAVLSGDQTKLFRYQNSTSNLLVYDMGAVAPVTKPAILPTPANGAVINLPLTNLVWTYSPYDTSYDLYFGTNQADVASATTASAEYLGRTASPGEPLQQQLSAGMTYYWRVDGVGLGITNTGSVWSFTASLLTVSQQSLNSIGIAGLPVIPQTFSFTSPFPTTWNLAVSQPWLSASTTNGTTPSSVTLNFNAATLTNGFYTNQILLTANGISLPITLVLHMYALNPSKMVADPDRDYIYILHPGSGVNADAFLLFLNTDTGIVEKVIPIGINPTDMSINRFEDRIYVSNWQYNQTHVVDLKTKTELPSLSLGTDVYQISGSIAGQVVIEGENQWITDSLIDTTNGMTTATTTGFYQGSGECDPSGQYYYHVEYDISDANITKCSVTNGMFLGITNAGSHYAFGSRNLVMSLDGSKLFWTSAMYDSNLVDFGTIGAEIYACTTDGSVAFSATQAIDATAKAPIFNLPISASVDAVDRLNRNLWYFDGTDGQIESLSLNTIATPVITAQPPATTNAAGGGNVSLAVSAGGLKPLSYQWWFGNAELVGATNFLLALNDMQFSQSGGYYVVVSNAFGVVTSAVAQVSVLVAPSITNQTSVVSALANGNATLSVQAVGTAPLAYQWSFDGVTIANATNSSLTIANAQSINEGYYQATVVNVVGTCTSSPMILRVLPASAAIASEPASVTVSAGNVAVLSAGIIGSAPLAIQWYQNEFLLPGANTGQLVISSAQAFNAGSYSVTVSNYLGMATSLPATLTVLPAKPAFVVQPASIAALAGTGVTLACQTIGTSDNLYPITYAWYFQNTRIPGQSGPQFTLPAIGATNGGNYFVVATNIYGSATSSVAELTVYLPPSFATTLSNEVVTVGTNVVLGATVIANPTPAYSWSVNAAPLTNATATLTFTNIQTSQAGYYSVTASNEFGSVSVTGKLSVLCPASQVVAWGDDSDGETNPPAIYNAVAVAGGDFHAVAIRRDGTLVAWGVDDEGQTEVPANAQPFVAIAAGADHNLAVAADGSLTGWGNDDAGQINIPAGLSSVLSVAAGESHSLALLSAGTVAAWGDNTYGQTDIPTALFPGYYAYYWWGSQWVPNPDWVPVQAIAAGRNHSLALMGGTVYAWGDNTFGQGTPPAGLTNAVAITAGYLHSAALRADGTVMVWGDNSFGQTNVPAGLTNVAAIAAGDFHTLALLTNGTIVGWGDNTFGQLNVPSAVHATVIASGYYDGLALVPVLPLLYPHLTAKGLIIQWHVPGNLQWAPTLRGPFIDVPSQGSIYTNTDMSAPAKFFRLGPN